MYRLKRKGRFATICFITIFLLSIGIGKIMASGPQEYRVVSVQAGDTLWELAEEYKPADMDVRKFVQILKQENRLADGMVYEHQALRVPMMGA